MTAYFGALSTRSGHREEPVRFKSHLQPFLPKEKKKETHTEPLVQFGFLLVEEMVFELSYLNHAKVVHIIKPQKCTLRVMIYTFGDDIPTYVG